MCSAMFQHDCVLLREGSCILAQACHLHSVMHLMLPDAGYGICSLEAMMELKAVIQSCFHTTLANTLS